MPLTTTSLLPAPVQQDFDNMLLSVAIPYMIHKIPAQTKRLRRKGGRTLRMRRYDLLPLALVPLGNQGVTPPSELPAATDIDATMDFYGLYVDINEQVTLQNQDPVLNEVTKLLGISMRMSEDALTRDMLAATAAVIDATHGVNGDAPTEINAIDCSQVTTTLVNNNAWMISHLIEGADKFNTSPIRDSFFCMSNSQMIPSIESIPGFVPLSSYPYPNKTLTSEWGSFKNMRFLTSSQGSFTPFASANGNTVFNNFVVGMEAYAVIEQDGMSAEFIYRPPIYSSPLAMNCQVGYKFAEVPRILNDLWVINFRSTLQR